MRCKFLKLVRAAFSMEKLEIARSSPQTISLDRELLIPDIPGKRKRERVREGNAEQDPASSDEIILERMNRISYYKTLISSTSSPDPDLILILSRESRENNVFIISSSFRRRSNCSRRTFFRSEQRQIKERQRKAERNIETNGSVPSSLPLSLSLSLSLCAIKPLVF